MPYTPPKMPAHRLDVSIAEVVRGYHIACENQDADGAERLDAMYTDLVAMRAVEIQDLLSWGDTEPSRLIKRN